VHKAQIYYPDCPEGFIVNLARAGDRGAFADLVRRRQSGVRNLMLRCCGDRTLADDLAQQVFMQVWLKLASLKKAGAFGGWLKRLAVTTWLQYLRKKDALRGATEHADTHGASQDATSIAMDLDRCLARLSDSARLCVVLSYHEGMSHREISDLTKIPLGTVKSHINRGAEQLRDCLSAYRDQTEKEDSR
jgi:RNA polymerase sigma-70 factor (ECF subfamily)